MTKRKDAPHSIPVHEYELNNKLTFHASKKVPKQWKKRDKTARYVYNLVVCLWIDLFEQNLMHPKSPVLAPSHYETIVHNIGRLVADEITSLNKFNLVNEIPELMTRAIAYTVNKITKANSIKKIVKKQHDNTNKSTTSMAKKKQPLSKKK